MDTAAFEYLLKRIAPLIARKVTVMREIIPSG